MMRERERMLARSPPASDPAKPVDLGAEAEVRAALPQRFAFGGRPFRLVELDGTLVAHSTVCPHWLGPLDDAPVAGGTVRCPWHGYLFDITTGRCMSRSGLALDPAPGIVFEGGRVIATTRVA